MLIVSKNTKKSGKKKETKKEKKTAGGAEAGKVPYHVTEKSKTTSEQSVAASAQLAEFGESVYRNKARCYFSQFLFHTRIN